MEFLRWQLTESSGTVTVQEDWCSTNAQKVFFALHQAVRVMRHELQSPVCMNKRCTENGKCWEHQAWRAPLRHAMQRPGHQDSALSPAKPEMAFPPHKCITFKMLKEVKRKKGGSVSWGVWTGTSAQHTPCLGYCRQNPLGLQMPSSYLNGLLLTSYSAFPGTL